MVVVGAGIVGLATARELALRHDGLRVVVLERESRIASHQSGRTSGVIHAGIYYRPGSLKARLCVAGARELYSYCDEHGIPALKSGKVIVATVEDELAALDELERRGRENGVPGLRRIGPERAARDRAARDRDRGAPLPRDRRRRLRPGGGELRRGAGAARRARRHGVRRRLAVTRGRRDRDRPPRPARPRPARRSAAPAPGRTASRPPAAPRPSLASFPSAAPTCGCARSAASWSGAASTRSRIPISPFSACT